MQTVQLRELFMGILLGDFLRYFIAAGVAYLFFWIIFKNRWRHRMIQQKSPRLKKMWFEFRYSMSTVLIFALIGFGIVRLKNLGYTRIYDDVDEWGWVWLFASFALMVLLHDAWFYWTHRLMHHPKIFRHVHLVHHRSTNPSPWAAYTFHPVEAVLEAGIFPLIVFTIPAHELALFGFLIYMISRNVLGHLGIEFLPNCFIKSRWVNWHTTTTHHDLHHQHFNGNYGLYFIWWDKWFGTEYPQYRQTFEEVTTRNKTVAPDQPARDLPNNSPAEQRFAATGNTKTAVILALSLWASMSGYAQSVAGLWQTFHDETGLPLSQIRIEEKAGSIEGRVTRIFIQPWEGDDPVCLKCNGARKSQKVIGMEFLWGFKKNGGKWSGGKILDPASGEVYDSEIWLEHDTVMKVRGYAGPGNLFYRTQTWLRHRTNDDGNPLTGVWKTIDDESGKVKSLVEISDKNGTISGRILKIYLQPWEGENPVCRQCPGVKKGSKIVGMAILWGFQKNGINWTDGSILDPGNGKTYTSSIWLENKDTLKVRGYWGPFFRTQTWRRME